MNDAKSIRNLQRILLFLVLLLTFEGLFRKMQLAGTGVLIFFLKDVVVLVLAVLVSRMRQPPAIAFLWNAYLLVVLLFLPLIFATALHDPLLALFGMKQYLLYPFVAFAMFTAHHESDLADFIRFFRVSALLLIPTLTFAYIELHLPMTHWLNLSVDGDDLSAFSRGGAMRVSSTFSFVAQYGIFLNAEMFMMVIALNSLQDLKLIWKAVYLALIPIMVASSYITGSRGAVVGNMSILAIAIAFSLFKFQSRSVLRVILILGTIAVTMPLAQHYFPDIFAAYSAREEGQLVGVSGEVQQRTFDALFGWVNGIFQVPLLGNGLAVMSNGTGQFSDYAANLKYSEGWTETDFATSLYEGGLYLIVVWYGLRIYVIFEIVRRFMTDVTGEIAFSAAFCVAFVILQGITGTLALQPPIAIWWWLSVGSFLVCWWKCVESPKDAPPPSDSPPPTPAAKGKIRGRSVYAERLHAGR